MLRYCTEMFTLVRGKERNQDQLFPIVLVLFPVPVPVLFLCSVNKPLVVVLDSCGVSSSPHHNCTLVLLKQVTGTSLDPPK